MMSECQVRASSVECHVASIKCRVSCGECRVNEACLILPVDSACSELTLSWTVLVVSLPDQWHDVCGVTLMS
eukprot:1130517-Rhodomonas_salina.1